MDHWTSWSWEVTNVTIWDAEVSDSNAVNITSWQDSERYIYILYIYNYIYIACSICLVDESWWVMMSPCFMHCPYELSDYKMTNKHNSQHSATIQRGWPPGPKIEIPGVSGLWLSNNIQHSPLGLKICGGGALHGLAQSHRGTPVVTIGFNPWSNFRWFLVPLLTSDPPIYNP